VNKGDIIRDGEDYFFIFCVMGSAVYVKMMVDVNDTPVYEWNELLKHYRKIEIMGSKFAE
jgi:hypothetical protein